MVQLIVTFIAFVTLLAAPQPYKRSSVVKAYRTCMKDKNFKQARQVLDDAMRDYPETAAQDAQLYKYKADALVELIAAENRKIYLKSNPDTVAYFNYIYDLYVTGLACDSVEQSDVHAKTAEGKKADAKLRSGVGQTLLPYRKNLVGAGKFHYRKKNYANAFKFLDMYAQTKTADVFLDSKGNTLVTDSADLQEVSVLAALSAYGSDNYRGVMEYLPESLTDTAIADKLLEVGSKSAAELGDTTEMIRLLEDGFFAYPTSEYFLMTLTKYYNDHGEYEKALEKAMRMTQLYPQTRDYWFMLGKEQMLLGKYPDALASFEECVQLMADDAESWAAIGNIRLRGAHEAYAQFNVPLSDPTYNRKKAAITERYKQACAAFEKAAKFAENNPDLWLTGLRETYFKLNRGKDLRALEKYSKQ